MDSSISHALQAKGAEATADAQSDPKARREFYLRAAAEHRAAAVDLAKALQFVTDDERLAGGYDRVAAMYRAAMQAEAKAAAGKGR